MQKRFYDQHSEDPKYQAGERVMVYVPVEVFGKKVKDCQAYQLDWTLETEARQE